MIDCPTADELEPTADLEAAILMDMRGESYNWCCKRHHDTMPEKILAAYRAKIAHELAEKQRAHYETLECYAGSLYDDGQVLSLPDLIDPEVTP